MCTSSPKRSTTTPPPPKAPPLTLEQDAPLKAEDEADDTSKPKRRARGTKKYRTANLALGSPAKPGTRSGGIGT